ncbi:MAG: fibronectin type III domain-containing protein, partial [Candidatus Sumerlaeaceae bacterium]|nr:fibronectin type III domain-containing protein [Candidatus Sumerlaeaceae bacterium]
MIHRLSLITGAATLLASLLALPVAAQTGNPLQRMLENFEGGGTAGVAAVTTANSSSGGASNSTFANVSEGGSRRLQMTDADGTFNGGVITFSGAITQPGYYLVTADVKVDNASAAIKTFGMGLKLGAPNTAKISDVNAGYVLNLSGTGDAAKGYQTIGAAIVVPPGTSLPAALSVYFGTDPSGNNYNASSFDGNFNGDHRLGTASWAAGSSNAVYIDNIRLIGPGNFGEERHYWLSLGDGYTDLAQLEQHLLNAKNNNFNSVVILARFRADAYYVPNRRNATYPNPEPMGTLIGPKAVSPTNDPLQYAIDRGRELGLKVFAAFGCFLVSPNNTYPAHLPSGSIMWFYNGGSPRPMTSSDPSAEGLWADFTRADVRQHTKNVLMDLVTNYDIDGIVFDRVRVPSYDYSYNPQGLAELGISGTPAPTDSAFRTARREALATFLKECYESVTTAKPWVIVGSAPVAYGTSLGDTYNYVLQHWPTWSARVVANRAISFGVMDQYQPQFYRLPPTGPAGNTTLMNKAQFGDVAVLASDYGLMPGAWCFVSPLLYHPNTGDVENSNANAQNITDSRSLAMSGWGLYRANTFMPDISLIRAPGASSAGTDVLGSPAPFPDYLFKKDYDNIPPNGVTGLSAAAQADGFVNLTWTLPAPAADGERPAKYLVYKSKTTPVKEYWSNLVSDSVPGTATSFRVPTGFAGTYYYRVVPVDDYNNRGPAAQAGPVTVTGEPEPPADIIVDNPQATATGAWTIATSAADKYGTNYYYKAPGTGSATVEFMATIPVSGQWTVSEWHSVGSNRTTAARHSIQHNGGTAVVTANQQINGGKFNPLGTYNFTAGQTYRTTIDDQFSGTVIIADAIRWSYVPQAPPAPSGLSASAASQTAINLTWTDNASNEANYVVYRSTTAGGPYTEVALLGVNVTAYADTGLSANTTYYYVVRALNSVGLSGASNEASATTLPNPPAAPSGLTATAASSSQINLTWTDNSTNESNFVVARATTSGGPYTDIATLAANTTSFSNTGLSAATTYYYVVRATNAGGASANSAQASATTLPNPPAAPSGLTATAASSSQINLTWTDNSTNESNFVVARATTAGGPYTDIATLAANTTSFS